jgi:hypothetical protein
MYLILRTLVLGIALSASMLLSCSDSGDPEKTAVEPSISDTIKFIGNLASVRNFPPYRDEVNLAQGNPCLATLSPSMGFEVWKVDFSRLSLESLKVEENDRRITARTTNAEPIIWHGDAPRQSTRKSRLNNATRLRQQMKEPQENAVYNAMVEEFNPGAEGYYDAEIIFYVGSEDDLERVRAALEHAITKCGGRKDLF